MKFKKKPIVIDAIQWTGDNVAEILDFVGHSDIRITKHTKNEVEVCELYINTLEGTMHASEEDWIIKGVHGELYPCKPDIFEETYEPAE